MLIGLGAVSALAVAGALGYALQTRNKPQAGQELLNTRNRPSPEGLAALPKDYTGLPRQAPPLGPPLPGDLGKPILNAGAASNTMVPGTTSNREAQHRAQEVEAARLVDCLPGPFSNCRASAKPSRIPRLPLRRP